jgi:hypothetical protein
MIMECPKCKDIIDRKDIPHVVRQCENCGRTMYVHEPDKHGKGIKIKKGDQFVIPANWLAFSPNPLKGTGRFTRTGLQWYAQMIFWQDLPKKKDQIEEEISNSEKLSDSYLKKSKLIEGLDIDNPKHSDEIINILSKRKDTPEWWAMIMGVFYNFARESIKDNDAKKAAWAMACAERARSMLVFKEQLEEVVWMGHSARRLVEILQIWGNNQNNKNEDFWQQTFKEHSYMLSQAFSVPVVFIKDKAYVGGMNIDQRDGKFIDYLFTSEISGDAVLIEIKTPETNLLGSKYRGVYKPSSEISGAVIQVLEYKMELSHNLQAILKGTSHQVSLFNPKCVLIAGNSEKQLKDEKKRKSFELFRNNLKDVEIVTYDELFRKAEVLASLFNLIKKKN